jgi:hypothetical protein
MFQLGAGSHASRPLSSYYFKEPFCIERCFSHDADVHWPCVQIDAVVESMLFGGESHKASSLGMCPWLSQLYPVMEGALMSIKALQLTGAARSFSWTPKSLGTAPAGVLSRYLDQCETEIGR